MRPLRSLGNRIGNPASQWAWAEVNHDIMAQAPVIHMWDHQAAVASRNVRAVQSGYSTTWDWDFTSIR
jgi:hypothetical protein